MKKIDHRNAYLALRATFVQLKLGGKTVCIGSPVGATAWWILQSWRKRLSRLLLTFQRQKAADN